MIDFYLKFASEEEANSVLFDGETPRFANIDVIGTIYTPTDKMDVDGYPMMKPIDGWHVNVRVINENTNNLEPFRINPDPVTPIRIWA